MFSRLLMILLAIALAVVAVNVDSAKNSNYCYSCTDIKLNRFSLNAVCYAADRETQELKNSLELNLCVGIDQNTAQLHWEYYGKFSNYCSNCSLDVNMDETTTIMTCTCSPLAGGPRGVVTSLDLNKGIGNMDGTMKCDWADASTVSA